MKDIQSSLVKRQILRLVLMLGRKHIYSLVFSLDGRHVLSRDRKQVLSLVFYLHKDLADDMHLVSNLDKRRMLNLVLNFDRRYVLNLGRK